MLFAIALDTREPIPATHTGQRAECPDKLCKCLMMSRCSDDPEYTNHWYGYHNGECISHYEPISVWHLGWQNQIKNPLGGVNTEVIINGLDRYKRADLKPTHGIVIEFQKSPITYNEVKLREKHYRKMIWVLHEERANHFIQNNVSVWHPKKSWYKNRNQVIPIFIDHGDWLSSDCLLSGSISKERFIDIFINSDSLDYNTLNRTHWTNIFNTFTFYNNILPKIEAEKKLTEIERKRKLQRELEWERHLLEQRILKEKQDVIERERLRIEESKKEYIQTSYAFAYFEKMIKYRISCYESEKELKRKAEAERLKFCDPQFIQTSQKRISETVLENEECESVRYKLATEDMLQSRFKLESWKQVVIKHNLPSVINADPTPEIEARFKNIEMLEKQMEDMIKQNIPTFKIEGDILNLKREIWRLANTRRFKK